KRQDPSNSPARRSYRNAGRTAAQLPKPARKQIVKPGQASGLERFGTIKGRLIELSPPPTASSGPTTDREVGVREIGIFALFVTVQWHRAAISANRTELSRQKPADASPAAG